MKKIIDIPKDWAEPWQGMPQYNIQDLRSFSSLIVHFPNKKDREDFAELVKQRITSKTKSIWFPSVEIFEASRYAYVDKNLQSKPIKRRKK